MVVSPNHLTSFFDNTASCEYAYILRRRRRRSYVECHENKMAAPMAIIRDNSPPARNGVLHTLSTYLSFLRDVCPGRQDCLYPPKSAPR